MRKYTLLALGFTLLSFGAYSQKTTEELGKTTFRYFQQNKLDSFYILKPSIAELTEFGKTIGIDSSSTKYKQFIDFYPTVIKNFKAKCQELRTDTTDLGFSWASAKLEKIETSTDKISTDNSKPDSRPIIITIIDIFFLSNNKRFKLSLGDTYNYNGIWKPGNNISLEELKE